MGLTLDKKKDMVRQYVYDVLTRERYELLDQYITKDFVDHFGGDIEGPAALVDQMTSMHKAFARLTFEIIGLIAEGDMVAAHMRASAKHSGNFAGQKATGAEVLWKGVMIYRFSDTHIQEAWGFWNATEIIATIQSAAQKLDKELG